ncbi:hypothetical protein MMC07_002143 [Pseudocyphellaria aurata]|nr:hypothetical protein [Pseudocyphellaria aurata]
MTSSGSATKVVKDVVLSDQSTWEPWYNNLKGTVPRHLWRFFDPEGTDVFVEPLPEQAPIATLPPVVASGPSTRSTTQRKSTQLDSDLTVRQWLQALKASSAPPFTTLQQTVRVDYQRFIQVGYSDWPTGGPGNWIGKWEDLMNRARKYKVTFDSWLTDVSTVWRPVPALTTYFDTLENRVIEGKAHKYTMASVSLAIQQHWERIQQGTLVKRAKPRTTRSAFTTQEATLGATEEPDEAPEPTQANEKPAKKKNKKAQANFR